MRIGVTGHQHLAQPEAWDWVRSEIDQIIENTPQPLIGISSLAVGTDQLFAELVLLHGGALEAVIPFPEYAERFAGSEQEAYRRLLEQAIHTITLPRTGSDEESYYAAGRLIVDSCDYLAAVWDGAPAKGVGGTGDVVAYAERVGKHILHLDPIKQQVGLHS